MKLQGTSPHTELRVWLDLPSLQQKQTSEPHKNHPRGYLAIPAGEILISISFWGEIWHWLLLEMEPHRLNYHST